MSTREMLQAIAAAMRAKAAEAHFEGMRLASNGARIGQFELIGTDAEVEYFLRMLLADGMVIIVDGKPVIVEQGEPKASIDIRITSGGGDS